MLGISKYVKVTHTWNLWSAFNPHTVHTHSIEHTHTVNTHPEQWAAIYVTAPGEQLGVRCLVQGSHLSRGIEGGERQCFTLTPPTYNSCRTWDSNSQPLGYESDSLTIRPRLPPQYVHCQAVEPMVLALPCCVRCPSGTVKSAIL